MTVGSAGGGCGCGCGCGPGCFGEVGVEGCEVDGATGMRTLRYLPGAARLDSEASARWWGELLDAPVELDVSDGGAVYAGVGNEFTL